MPISKENRKRYPKGWKLLSKHLILTRRGNTCEVCGIHNHNLSPITGKIQTLQVAHLNHIPEDIRQENLKVMCNGCHNNYDKQHRKESRYIKKHRISINPNPSLR
jgi:hypothetical protein